MVHTSTHFDQHFMLPKINFNQKGKIASSTRLQKNELRFNPILLDDNVDAFWRKLFLMKCFIYKLFSLSRQTYHQMDVNKVKGKSFHYQCQCGPTELGIRKHNKVINGKQIYVCKRC
jgi:SprT protein